MLSYCPLVIQGQSPITRASGLLADPSVTGLCLITLQGYKFSGMRFRSKFHRQPIDRIWSMNTGLSVSELGLKHSAWTFKVHAWEKS